MQATRGIPAGRAWRGFFVAGAFLIALHFVIRGAAQSYLYDVIGVAGVAAILAGVRLQRPPSALPWYLIAAGQTLSVAGDVTYDVYDQILRAEVPFPSLADVFYLAQYPLTVAGVLLMLRARRPGRDVGSLLDTLLVTTGLALAAWVFLMAPHADARGVGLDEQMGSMAYPLMDLILLGVLARVVLDGGQRTASPRLLMTGVFLLVAADVTFAWLELNGTYSTGGPVDAGWLLTYVIWGVAALHPSMTALTERGETVHPLPTRWRLVVLAAGVLVIPAVPAVQALRGLSTPLAPVAACFSVAFVIVMVRLDGLTQALKASALRDPLTGLPNRVVLADRLSSALGRIGRSRDWLTVAYLDLDTFKLVNDDHGHEVGDDVLATAALRLARSVRPGDTVARVGGDEFVVVCEGVGPTEVDHVVDRLSDALAEPQWVEGRPIVLTASIGVETTDDATLTPDELLRRADAAMYSEKRMQRLLESGSRPRVRS